MKLLTAFCVLTVFAAQVFAQELLIISELDFDLTNNCDGSGGCIADGSVVEIHLDLPPAGPGPEDPLADVGPAPQQWNFNTFLTNPSLIGACGGFFNFDSWSTNAAAPSPAGPFYLRLVGTNSVWTSGTRSFGSGPAEWEADDWVCVAGDCIQPAIVDLSTATPECFFRCLDQTTDVRVTSCPPQQAPLVTQNGVAIAPSAWTYLNGAWHFSYVGEGDGVDVCFVLTGCDAPPCLPSGDFTHAAWNTDPSHASGWPAQFCLQVCPGSVTRVTITSQNGGPHDPNLAVYYEVKDGCEPVATRCDEHCPAGHATISALSYDSSGHYVITMVGQIIGCVCFEFNQIGPAELRTFDATAMNNCVRIDFETASETNVDHFEILRGVSGSQLTSIASLPAHNGPMGAAYSFTDNDAQNGTTYVYDLATVDLDGSRSVHGQNIEATPRADLVSANEFALLQNYPNPFNAGTTISFVLPEAQPIWLALFDVTGRLVREIARGNFSVGLHNITLDGEALGTGVYFARLSGANGTSRQIKLLLLK